MPTRTAQPPMPLAVKASTAARLLDCSRQYVYELMAAGRLGRIQIPGSRSVRIPIADIYALLGMEAPSDAA